jgi:hypothetical protein
MAVHFLGRFFTVGLSFYAKAHICRCHVQTRRVSLCAEMAADKSYRAEKNEFSVKTMGSKAGSGIK